MVLEVEWSTIWLNLIFLTHKRAHIVKNYFLFKMVFLWMDGKFERFGANRRPFQGEETETKALLNLAKFIVDMIRFYEVRIFGSLFILKKNSTFRQNVLLTTKFIQKLLSIESHFS